LVAEGFDVAIRAGALADSTMIARRLGTLKRVLVAAPAYLRRRGIPQMPLDLEKHDAIIFGSGPNPRLWTLQDGRRSIDIRVSPRLSVNDLEWVQAAARAGLGIALLPHSLCSGDVKKGTLRRVLTDWSSGETPFHALYSSARHLSPKVIAFVEAMRKGFAAAQRAS